MSNTTNVLEPPEPGHVLREFLHEMGFTQDVVAGALGVSRIRLNAVLNGRRAVTAETALRLARVLNTSAEFWLNLQVGLDIHRAKVKMAEDLECLPVLRNAPEIPERAA
jgi:addiction module HigA family antidote